jgi:hypothetical protein
LCDWKIYTALLAVLCEAAKIAVNSFASVNRASVLSNGRIPDSVINSNHKIASSASSRTTPILATNSAFDLALHTAR